MNTKNRVILCNTTAQVMATIPWDRAICLLFSGKAISIKDTETTIHSPSVEIMMPEIIMLTNYVNDHAFQHDAIERRNPSHALPKTLVHERDNWTCAYCGEWGDTIDHIVPKCLGGAETWDNVITACTTCNGKKDDKLLSELGWELLYEPVPLTRANLMRTEQEAVDAAFAEYIN